MQPTVPGFGGAGASVLDGWQAFDATTLTPKAPYQDLRVRNLTVTGTAAITSTTTSTGQFLGANGTAGAPSYSFTNSATTGFFRQAADVIGVSIATAEKCRISATAIDLGTEHLLFGTDIGTPTAGLVYQTSDTAGLQVTVGSTVNRGPIVATQLIAVRTNVGGGGYIFERMASDGSWRMTNLTPTTMLSMDTTLNLLVLGPHGGVAAPAAKTFRAEGSRSGTDANVGGANLTIQSGPGTGTGTVSSLIFQTPTTVGAGSGAQTMATRLTVATASITATVPYLAANGSGGAPSIAFSSDSNIGFFLVSPGTSMGLAIGGSGKFLLADLYLQFTSNHALQWSSTAAYDSAPDLYIRRRAAATFQFGAADAAAPVAQTIAFQGSRGGTDSNVAGVVTTFQASLGTGNAALPAQSFNFTVPVLGASGTTQQTAATRFQITDKTSGWTGNVGGGTAYQNGLFVDAGKMFASCTASYATPDIGLFAYGTGIWAACTNTTATAGDFACFKSTLTTSTMTRAADALIRVSQSKFTWTNAQVTALGAVTAGDIQVCTLPAKTVVLNCYMVVDTQAAGVTTLTGAVGRVSATYIDYIVASDLKAAANTVYGDASAERGTNLTGYDLPSYTATTGVFLHLISTGGNLNDVTTCTGTVHLTTMLLP